MRIPWQKFLGYFRGHDYWLTRRVFQRGLALVYLIAFLIALNQFVPLLGERGILPVPNFVKHVSFLDSPSLFFLFPKDWAFTLASWLGIALSLFALSGFSEKRGWLVSALVWGAMWLLYISFVNVGQTFYGFGWETMLLEAGVLAVFLGDEKTAPSLIVIFLIRWMLFRTMFGAGLIKLRGDSCWRDLTCLYYHYETQPMPNPLSWFFNWFPKLVHQFGVLFNHFTELIVPFAYFATPAIAAIAGLITLFFHGWLMVSGNYSFLGLLTMVLATSTLNDKQDLASRAANPPSVSSLLSVYGSRGCRRRRLFEHPPRPKPHLALPGHEHFLRPSPSCEFLRSLRNNHAPEIRGNRRRNG